MKKTLIPLMIAVISIFYSFGAKAQGWEITPIVGYTFADKFDVSDGYGRIGDGLNYGIILSKSLNPHYNIEFFYSRQEAKGEFTFYDYYTGIQYSDYEIPLSVNYFQIGGCRTMPLGSSGKVEGFGGINLGAVLISPKDYDDAWRFAFGLKLGTKFWLSDLIGIRLQGNLNMPIQGAGVGIYAGSGGVSTGVSTFTTITQFGFTGGLIFRLGRSSTTK
jgi:hypothetical protein